MIDMAALTLHEPQMVSDLPSQASRWIQTASGYTMTMVAGTPTCATVPITATAAAPPSP